MEELLDTSEAHKIEGHIYKIVNIINNKCYIGQTRSHRLNRNKYRPFGYIGRFKDHISEAFSSSKKNQCTYLNNAFKKYGTDNFRCELITICNLEQLDDNEINYIIEYNSKYPNGYNLTDGGQSKGFKKGSKIILNENDIINELPLLSSNTNRFIRNDYTKALISKRLKEHTNNPDTQKKYMISSQKQHLNKKYERFKNVKIDGTNIDQYIRVIKNHKENSEYVRININGQKTNFVGKHETLEKTKQRASMFILDLLKWQDNLDAGTPLEPLLPLNDRNVI